MVYQQDLFSSIKFRQNHRKIFAKYIYKGFPGGLDGKSSARNAGDLGSIPGLERSHGEGKWQPIPVLLPGKSYGWRSLVGYSPWGCRESGTIEQLHIYIYITIIISEWWDHGFLLLLKFQYDRH